MNGDDANGEKPLGEAGVHDIDTDIDDATLLRLLAVQECDARLDALDARRAHPHSQMAFDRVKANAASLRPRLMEATGLRDEVVREQAAIESEIAAMRRRVEDINARLFDASIRTAPDDALKMSHEVEQLNQRVRDAEDRELDCMMRREPLDAAVAELTKTAVALREDLAAAQQSQAAERLEVDAESDEVKAKRNEMMRTIPSPLRERYERDRGRGMATVIAPVAGRTCGGCHLSLSSMDMDRLRKATPRDLPTCPECGCILVYERGTREFE